MQEPIRTVELYKTFATAFVAWVVVMGYWPMTPEQQALTLTLAIAGINLVGAYIQNRQTTPLSRPTDVDGAPLSRDGDVPPIKVMDAIQEKAIELNKEITRGLE